MDILNELGKGLKKDSDKAKRGAKKQSPDFGMSESVRDIFDWVVPFSMHFRVPSKERGITATLRFELPPSNIDMGNCCGDCFCANCEKFDYTDGTTLLLTYPYIPNTVRLVDPNGAYTRPIETDPEAGIIDLQYTPDPDPDNIIQVCYYYKYDANCTTEFEEITTLTDSFDRADGSVGTADCGLVWTVNESAATVQISGNRLYMVTSSDNAYGAVIFYNEPLPLPLNASFEVENLYGATGFNLTFNSTAVAQGYVFVDGNVYLKLDDGTNIVDTTGMVSSTFPKTISVSMTEDSITMTVDSTDFTISRTSATPSPISTITSPKSWTLFWETGGGGSGAYFDNLNIENFPLE